MKRTHPKTGNGKSVKVRDLPEDGARDATHKFVKGLVSDRCGSAPNGRDEPLEFRGQNNPATRHYLAAMEARALRSHQRGHGHRN